MTFRVIVTAGIADYKCRRTQVTSHNEVGSLAQTIQFEANVKWYIRWYYNSLIHIKFISNLNIPLLRGMRRIIIVRCRQQQHQCAFSSFLFDFYSLLWFRFPEKSQQLRYS